VATAVTTPTNRRTGMNSRSGSSRYAPSAPGRLLRSAVRRSDSRISAPNAASIAPRYTAAQPSRKIASGITALVLRRVQDERREISLVVRASNHEPAGSTRWGCRLSSGAVAPRVASRHGPAHDRSREDGGARVTTARVAQPPPNGPVRGPGGGQPLSRRRYLPGTAGREAGGRPESSARPLRSLCRGTRG